jgi:hypothetical protein
MVNQDTFFTSSGSSPTQQRKPPAKRLFTGMAGSPLARITEVATPQVSNPPIPKTDAPLKPTWLTQAHWDSLTHNDQVAYSRARWSEEHGAWIACVPGIAQKETKAEAAKRRRAEKTAARLAAKAMVRERAKVSPTERKIEDERDKWRKKKHVEAEVQEDKRVAAESAAILNPTVTDGSMIHGQRLITGGYDADKLGVVDGAHKRDEKYGGRKSRPEGAGPNDEGGKFITTKTGTKYVEDHTPHFQVQLSDGSTDLNTAWSLAASFACPEIPDTDVHKCKVCGFETDWWRIATQHFVREAELEAEVFRQASERAKLAAEALLEMALLVPEKMAPMSIVPPRLGGHAQIFEDAKKLVEKEKRKRDKAGRKKSATGQAVENKTDIGK